MVRLKNRWLLVRFDFESDIVTQCLPTHNSSDDDNLNGALSKKRKLEKDLTSSIEAAEQDLSEITTTDIYRAIQESLSSSFGVIGAATTDIQVRLYDAKARLAIIRTTREQYPTLRTSISFVSRVSRRAVVPTIIAVGGSPRTARAKAWKEVRRHFFDGRNNNNEGGGGNDGAKRRKAGDEMTKKGRVSMEKQLKDLEGRMDKIDTAC